MPLNVRDADDTWWLLSCVWPEHMERRERLTAAIALARTRELELHQGDLVLDLPALLTKAPRDATLVVFQENAGSPLKHPSIGWVQKNLETSFVKAAKGQVVHPLFLASSQVCL